MILPGSTAQSFAATLAAETGEQLARVAYDRFPDGELLVEIESGDAVETLAGERAIVVASTTGSDAHVECLQLQDAAREAGASEVVTVLPYMGYARQDEAFKAGQPVSSRAVARAIASGTDRVIAVNPHEDAVLDFFDVPTTAVDAAACLAEPLPTDLVDPLFLSPDEGAIDVAETVRDAYVEGVAEGVAGGESPPADGAASDGAAADHFVKERDRDTGAVSIEPADASVADRDVVVTDDIVATGSTMSEAVGLLAERGAGRIYAACVHPMLAGNAVTKLSTAGVERVYGTDTVERAVSAVSAAPAVAEEL